MDYLSSQFSIVNLPPTVESAQFFGTKLKRLDMLLLVETALVMITGVFAIKIFQTSLASGTRWFVTPGILVSAALIPTVIRKTKLFEIGPAFKQIKCSLVVLGWSCFVVFPAMFCGLWLLKSYGLNCPLRPVLPQKHEWVCWLFYQFMYIAVAEEIFFRGYVQGNILTSMSTIIEEKHWLQQWISIVLSAACFAVAHILVQGRIISGLTFFPGLILGWLFIRTKSLVGPILFHGLANVCYFVMAGILV